MPKWIFIKPQVSQFTRVAEITNKRCYRTAIIDELADNNLSKQGSLLAGLYLPVESTTGHSKNRGVTSIWATLWMSRSGTSLTTNVVILHRQFDRSSLMVCSLTSEVLANLKKGVPPLAYFDWRGWFRAGLPFSGKT
ncbi:hypothetical protein J6590_096670 [Homalodisca vitripennis]|nr:hypothetical protein J6590_096670 [Homalodisca vitripennis]